MLADTETQFLETEDSNSVVDNDDYENTTNR